MHIQLISSFANVTSKLHAIPTDQCVVGVANTQDTHENIQTTFYHNMHATNK